MTTVTNQNIKNSQYLDTWFRLQNKIKANFSEAKYRSWLCHLDFVEQNGSELILSAPTRFIKEWIKNNYLERIIQLAANIAPNIKIIDIVIRSNINTSKKNSVKVSSKNISNNIDVSGQNIGMLNANDNDDDLGSPLDRRYNFGSFIVGPANQLAFATANAISKSDKTIPGNNPLYIHGGVGLGKTHLLHAIALHIKDHNPKRRVVYLSAEKFMYQFIRAIRSNTLMDFKESFRGIDVLLIDDVQFICGKKSTQDEFFHTFNALIDENKQLIISGDRAPSKLDLMNENIRSRLAGGIVADISNAPYELRLGVLKSKIEQMRNVKIDIKVLEFLAQKITSNIRELEGALNKIVAHSLIIGKKVTVEHAQEVLCDLLTTSEKTITIMDIQKKVSEYFGIKISDLTSSRRSRNIARPRQVAMFLSKTLTTRSLSEIGRKFGGKDHTTVIHAVKKVEEILQKDNEFAGDINLIKQSLQSVD